MSWRNQPPITFAFVTSGSLLETKTMTRRKTMMEKGNKSIWTLDSEAAKRILQLAEALWRCRLGAATLLVGKERLVGNPVHSY